MKISSVTSVIPRSIVFVGFPKKVSNLLNPTERCLAWHVVADTPAKVVLFAIDNNAGVPDAVHLLAYHLARKLSRHAV